MKKTVLITGGHVTPALAVIEGLQKSGEWNIVYVARQQALHDDSQFPAEYEWIEKRGITVIPIRTAKLNRTGFLDNVLLPYDFCISLWQAFQIIRKTNPSVVLSFGGHVAVPIALVAFIKGIPVVTHEQTMRPGLANRIIAHVARVVCVSWKESISFFNQKKVVVTGNPTRLAVLTKVKGDSPKRTRPLLYITGGSLGAMSINAVIYKMLPDLLKTFDIVHQCGSSYDSSDFKKLNAYRNTLSKTDQNRYTVITHSDPDEVASLLHQATCMIARGGANTLTEIIMCAIPSVVIPIPFASGGEQTAHAKYLEEHEAGIHLDQSDVSANTLHAALEKLFEENQTYRKNLKLLQQTLPKNPSQHIIATLTDVTS